MKEPKSNLEHQLYLLGGHLYHLATDMNSDPNDGKPRPTRFGLSLGFDQRDVVRVIVEIRPSEGPHSGWNTLTNEEVACPVLKGDASAPPTPADVWDHVMIYDGLDPKGTPTDLGPRGKQLYSGNRIGACTFFAQHCAVVLAMAHEKDAEAALVHVGLTADTSANQIKYPKK